MGNKTQYDGSGGSFVCGIERDAGGVAMARIDGEHLRSWLHRCGKVVATVGTISWTEGPGSGVLAPCGFDDDAKCEGSSMEPWMHSGELYVATDV